MLPSLQIFEQIQHRIFSIPNQRKETKRREHYCLFLLGNKAGLRVSEAVNFDLSKKARNGLYQITKTKGKKERFAYIPPQVISELKRNNWKPNSTNRFNFYHFLRKIKQAVNLPANTELTPHTLRRAFATFNAENGLPLPLLSKMLGHQSIRTTALYWMNTYHPDDDDDNDTGTILAGKNWLDEHETIKPDSELPIINEIPPQPERISPLTENSPALWEINQSLSNYQQQLIEKDQQITELVDKLTKAEEQNADLRDDLSNLSEQNTTLRQALTHAAAKQEQNLAERDKTIKHLEQKLTTEREQKTIIQNNLAQEKAINQSLRETNANLTQKLNQSEQNHTSLTNAYQQAIKDKETTEKQLNQLTREVKNIAKALHQWQKLNYYQQQEKPQFKAQIVQPPPWKLKN